MKIIRKNCQVEFIAPIEKKGVYVEFSNDFGETKDYIHLNDEEIRELVHTLDNYLNQGCLF